MPLQLHPQTMILVYPSMILATTATDWIVTGPTPNQSRTMTSKKLRIAWLISQKLK
jgi:hypothetical protein